MNLNETQTQGCTLRELNSLLPWQLPLLIPFLSPQWGWQNPPTCSC